jgi:sRNA-binding protein
VLLRVHWFSCVCGRTASHASEALATEPSWSYLIVSKAEEAMPSTYQIERNRGTKDARQQLAVLRVKWPLAFPAKHQDVRPLAVGAAREIAAAMGWSLPYTLGVLVSWKMAPVYCEAVLRYDQRVALDGSRAETIDAEAKELATKQLARLAARETAKKSLKAAVPAMAASPTTETPPETPDQLRGRVRASLLRRSA